MYICNMQKILIIRFSSIGDIVLTSPVLRVIKTQKPDIKIHFLSKKAYAPVLENNPHIDHLVLLDDDIQKTIKELRREKYDYIIDLHKNLRTFRIKKALRVNASSYEKLNWEKWLLVKFSINNLPHVHIVQRYFDTVKKIRIRDDGKGLEYYSGLETEKHIQGLPDDIAQQFAVIVIGGTYYTKQIPVSKIIELIHIISIPIVLLGGPEDEKTAKEVETTSPKKIHNTVGKSTLNESAEIIRRSQFVISGDTGLMHIAAAYQKKIFSIWGNTVPTFGMYPYMPENPELSTIIENKELKCRPCSKLGFNECPKQHFECMLKLDFSEIKDYCYQFK